MEIESDDGRTQAWRCYDAIATVRDVEDGQALWRAFGRYFYKGQIRQSDTPLGARVSESVSG
jgi:hypothetical protein